VQAYELITKGGATDFARLIEACNSFGPYCLIGGLAVNCYVEPVYTLDADIVARGHPELKSLYPRELDVAALLANLDESSSFEPSLDFAEGLGLSRPNLYLDSPNLGWPGGLRQFEVKFQRFLQVGESFFFGLSLAGDIDFEALRDIPVSFTPNGCGKRSLHDHILSQTPDLRTFHCSGSISNYR